MRADGDIASVRPGIQPSTGTARSRSEASSYRESFKIASDNQLVNVEAQLCDEHEGLVQPQAIHGHSEIWCTHRHGLMLKMTMGDTDRCLFVAFFHLESIRRREISCFE